MNELECPVVKLDSTCYWKDTWRKLDRMRHQWQLCDVSLVSEDNRIFMAHSPVLAASSYLFHDLLIQENGAGFDRDASRKLYLNRVPSDVLKVTLDFIYGITPSTRRGFEMLQVGAKQLGIAAAYEYCSKHLRTMSAEALVSDRQAEVSCSSQGNMTTAASSYAWTTEFSSQASGTVDTGEWRSKLSSLGTAQRPRELSLDAKTADSAPSWSAKVNRAKIDQKDEAVQRPEPSRFDCISEDTEPRSSHLSIHGDMPVDDIHSGVFTQMSLVDLTAGIKCPHIQGIIGENNPMDAFLGDEDCDENEADERLQAKSAQDAESDFDETPTLEDNSVGLAVQPVPLKKRRRKSPEIGGETKAAVNIQSNFSQNNPGASDRVILNDVCDAVSSRSAHAKLCSSSVFFDSSGLAMTGNVEPDRNKSTGEQGTMTDTVLVPTTHSRAINLDCEDLKLSDSQRMSCEMLPSCSSLFYSCVSTESQNYQSLAAFADSNRRFSNDSEFQLGQLTDCSYSPVPGTRAFAGSLPVTQAPPVLGTPCVAYDVASSVTRQHLPAQQGLEEDWKASVAWAVPNSKACFIESDEVLASTRRSVWEEMSHADPFRSQFSSSHGSIANPPTAGRPISISNDTFKPKFFSSQNQVSQEIRSKTSSDSLMTCAVAANSGEVPSLMVLGPCQGIVPSSLVRRQPIEICPSVGDISIPESTVDDTALIGDGVIVGSADNVQKGFSDLVPDDKNVSDKYHCDMCSKEFKSASQLNGHKRRSHPRRGDEGASASRLGVIHQCQYCQESFKSSYKLQTHQLKVHSKGKLFSCQDCNFRSPRKKDVQAHILSQHGRAPSGVKVYCCSSCNYKCIDRNRFEEHEAKHTGITSHSCPLCGRAYTTKRGMRTHLKYHSDERPHKCNICGAAFKVTSKLGDHMKLIHLQKGVKPYKCGYCDHATALRGNCNQHIRKNHPGQPLLVIDKFASQRKSVKDYDYAGMAGEGIEEHRNLESANVRFKYVVGGVR